MLALIAVAAIAAACRQEPAGLAPRHVAVLSEEQVAAPLTIATVEDELHVLFASLDTLTLQLARLDPRRNRLTLETIDAVGIYPSDLTAFRGARLRRARRPAARDLPGSSTNPMR